MNRSFIPWLCAGLILELGILLFSAPILAILNAVFAPYGQATYNVAAMLLGAGLALAALTGVMHRQHSGRHSNLGRNLG